MPLPPHLPPDSPAGLPARLEPKERRYLKATLAGSAGGLVTILIVLLEQRPELARLFLERVIVAWGPQFVIVVLLFALLYLLADRYAPRLIAAQSQTALALQNLAAAVEQLLARDNSFQREQDVLLNHVARRLDALHRLVESHHRSLNGHLSRLSRLPRTKPRGAKPREARPRSPSRPHAPPSRRQQKKQPAGKGKESSSRAPARSARRRAS